MPRGTPFTLLLLAVLVAAFLLVAPLLFLFLLIAQFIAFFDYSNIARVAALWLGDLLEQADSATSCSCSGSSS